MKRRGKRISFMLAGAVLASVTGLAMLHREGIRNHLEAWRFQLARETEMLEPDLEDPGWIEVLKIQVEASGDESLPMPVLLEVLANSSRTPVISDRAREERWIPWGKRDFAAETALHAAREAGLHVLEQCFPRRAYVVVSDDSPGKLDEAQELERLLDQLERAPPSPQAAE